MRVLFGSCGAVFPLKFFGNGSFAHVSVLRAFLTLSYVVDRRVSSFVSRSNFCVLRDDLCGGGCGVGPRCLWGWFTGELGVGRVATAATTLLACSLLAAAWGVESGVPYLFGFAFLFVSDEGLAGC